MPRCFPPDPPFGEGRHGERAVWTALKQQLPDDAVLFYSRWFTEQGRELEIDVLVALPGVGLAAVEVKGGQVERDGLDQWWSLGGGSRHRIDHPMLQASDARHALQRFLRQRRAAAASVRIQHLVALPHMDIAADYDPSDLPRAQVVDRGELADVVPRLCAAVEAGDGQRPLDDAALEELVQVLVARLPGQASALALAEEHAQLVDQATEEQSRIMGHLRNFPRLAVIGGAGTGKTWLALEQAKRLTKDGQRVALVCYSRGLGRFLQRMAATWPKPPAYVGLFHDLAIDWGAPPAVGDESDYYEEELPRALHRLAGERPLTERFDAVVVDEAQDFGELWWPSLLACLKDPAEGGVYVFMDEAQRVFSRTSEPPIDLPPYVLDENIRNTKRIAQTFGSLAKEQVRYSTFEGPQVRFVPCTSDEASGRADDALDALLDDWEPGQVALLTTKHRHNLHNEGIQRGWAEYWDDFFSERDVFYGHVLGFKGLERPCVVLAVNGFKQPERAKEMLYVGLSRARTQLVVVGDLDEIAAVGGEGVRRRLEQAQQWSP